MTPQQEAVIQAFKEVAAEFGAMGDGRAKRMVAQLEPYVHRKIAEQVAARKAKPRRAAVKQQAGA